MNTFLTSHNNQQVLIMSSDRANFSSFNNCSTSRINKNEPSRFLGEGVSFKAKLIGILEVNEARGDRMCQEALSDLKMAIRAAGEHKQRITINIAIDGLRLKDEKNDCLYHHPVHKISFIAQDMSDSRAFGYIFGSPDTGHRFFGIKTDKAASQVVIAMRDLFQVVFELKKKEIEMAKQHIEQQQIKICSSVGLLSDSGSVPKNGPSSSTHPLKIKSVHDDSSCDVGNVASAGKPVQQTPEVIADLLDLEFELNNIQQGIHQMERITPSDPLGPSSVKDDPFGDSFTPSTFLPPPPKIQKPKPVTTLPLPTSEKHVVTRSADSFEISSLPHYSGSRTIIRQTSNIMAVPVPAPVNVSAPPQQEKHWFDRETESLFEEGELVTPPFTSTSLTISATIPPRVDQIDQEMKNSPPKEETKMQFDVFTELDPLGTGRSKPYIDRKDFFQDLKNPPKKVLKDMVSEAPSEGTAPLFQANFDASLNANAADKTSKLNSTVEITDINSSSVLPPTTSLSTKPSGIRVDPFIENDPFYKTDPFENDNFTVTAGLASSSHKDPFDIGFADFTKFEKHEKFEPVNEVSKERRSSKTAIVLDSSTQASFHGPLRVSLPPEKKGQDQPAHTGTSFSPIHQMTVISSSGFTESLSRARSKMSRLQKQKTTAGFVKIPSPKSSQRLTKQMTVDVYSGNINPSPTPPTTPTSARTERKSPLLEHVYQSGHTNVMSPPMIACFPDAVDTDNSSRISGSSLELSEFAPEPPPRPVSTIIPIMPPPLPPKRQQISEPMRLPPRPHDHKHPHYDYIENYETSSRTVLDMDVVKSPPIPVPARKTRFADEFGSSASRHNKHLLKEQTEPDYVPPFPLLPPPQKKSPSVDTTKHDTTTIASFLHSHYIADTTTPERHHSKPTNPQLASGTSLDITLSQLTKTGLGELAAVLGVSSSQLSSMTLQDFTKYLAQLTEGNQAVEENEQEKKNIQREKYATLRESVDDETAFKAEFDAHFENENTEKLEDVFQEAPFDKYAVFRELIEQESTAATSESKEETDLNLIDPLASSTLTEEGSLKASDSLKEIVESSAENKDSVEESADDKYAALRDISSVINTEKEDVDTSSEKEKSIGDSTKVEEDDELLASSRQHSESTESPTLDSTVVREPQSIIESTIFEEESSIVVEPDNIDTLNEVDSEKSSLTIPTVTKEQDISDISSERLSNKEFSEIAKGKEINNLSSEGWAKFDAGQFESQRPISEVHSEGGLSPWSSDGKEFSKTSTSWKEQYEMDRNAGRRRKKGSRARWQETEETGDGWDAKTEKSWKENGWSEESLCGDSHAEKIYRKECRRRKISPWKGKLSDDRNERGNRRWQKRYIDDDEDEEDEDDDEDYNVSWESKSRYRGSSRDDTRRRKYGPREVSSGEYDDGYRRRPSPWKNERERRGSWESASWDEEERFPQKEYGERYYRDDDYRRRLDGELDGRGYVRSRKYGGPDNDYMYQEHMYYRKQSGNRYYRERSRESPWEDEYSEHGEGEPRFPARKYSWPKRPNSASAETGRNNENSGDLKPRVSEKQQHSLPATLRTETGDKSPGYSYPEWRYRDRYHRPRSRDEYFGSDQDYDYWSSQERPPRRADIELGYEQRSQTLQPKRLSRFRKPQEQNNKKSPFDDDFCMQPFEFTDKIDHTDESNNICEIAQTKSPSLMKLASESVTKSEAEGNIPAKEPASVGISESKDAEIQNDLLKSRLSKGSNHRQSPFEDDFSAADTRHICARLTSSVSSDISDYPRSPFEEGRGNYKVESVAEEMVCDSDLETKTEKTIDEVFLPTDSIDDTSKDSLFTQFDSDVFSENVINKVTPQNTGSEKRLSSSVWSSEDSGRHDKSSSAIKLRMSNLFRVDSSSSLKKSESINIFARETDPFDDDFFQATAPATLPRPRHDSQGSKPSATSNSDTFNWTKAFESFNFEEET